MKQLFLKRCIASVSGKIFDTVISKEHLIQVVDKGFFIFQFLIVICQFLNVILW
ncbi:MAG: hypothetical protein IIX48_02815 [Lachnospiraceae bacterium]|nr:hypothetical protein [Lachnospiraceae bacterium]